MTLEIEEILEAYSQVFVIISPPRCSSTALARVFWEHPLIRYYSHEPFEAWYFLNQDLDDVFNRLKIPLDLRPLKRNPEDCVGNGIIIKEMPYQVGTNFELLVNLATAPIVFLIRDPRLNISSRMKKKIEVGESPLFPLIETGWKLLEAQITFCRAARIPHVVVDSRDFRNHPKSVLKALFTRLGLTFTEDLLNWKPNSDIDIDNLEGKHTHLYKKVLQSDHILPEQNPIPSISTFPEENGFRPHVIECQNIYLQLRELEEMVNPSEAE